MELARDLPGATEGSSRLLTKGMGTLTPLSACSTELRVQALLGFPASLGASGEAHSAPEGPVSHLPTEASLCSGHCHPQHPWLQHL